MTTLIRKPIPEALLPGVKLPNGFTVVAVRPADGYENPTRWFVLAVEAYNLCYSTPAAFDVERQTIKYATWEAHPDGTTYWGHYFDDRPENPNYGSCFEEAYEDFQTRGGAR